MTHLGFFSSGFDSGPLSLFLLFPFCRVLCLMEFAGVSSYLLPFESFSFLASKFSSLMMVKKLCMEKMVEYWDSCSTRNRKRRKGENIKNLVTFVPCETHVIKAKVIKVKCELCLWGKLFL